MKNFLIVECDIVCDWETEDPPSYRVYVEDELFVERTYIWKDEFLQEMIQLSVDPGWYEIKYEVLDNTGVDLKIKEIRLTYGPHGSRVFSAGDTQIKVKVPYENPGNNGER
jgi:hypothetical protein